MGGCGSSSAARLFRGIGSRSGVWLALLLSLGVVSSASAARIVYGVSWSGAGGSSLQGLFSFDESKVLNGMIGEEDLLGFEIEGFGEVPVQLIQALPYIMTVVLLAGFIGKAVAPKAIGIPYVKER